MMMLRRLLRSRVEQPPPPPEPPVEGVMVCGGQPSLFVDGAWVPALPVERHEVRWYLKDGTGVAIYYRDGAEEKRWTARDAGRQAQEYATKQIQADCEHVFVLGSDDPRCVLCRIEYDDIEVADECFTDAPSLPS